MNRLQSALPAEVRTSRLLAAYLLLGLVGGIVSQPVRTVVNYLLLAGYVALIDWWLRGEETVADAQEEVRRPRRDIAVVVAVAALAMAAVTWFWFGPGPRQLLLGVRDVVARSGIDSLLALKIGNAVIGIVFLLVPAAIVTVIAGLRPRLVGLVPRRIELGIVLALISAAVGVGAMVSGQVPAVWKGHEIFFVPALLVIQVGINGLPEEFIFRGLILSRLLAVLRSPGAALVISSILFSAFHIPSDLAQPGHPPWWGVIPSAVLSPGYQPTGLIWGYLFYRVRSIWPGLLWHTSSTVFGFIFW